MLKILTVLLVIIIFTFFVYNFTKARNLKLGLQFLLIAIPFYYPIIYLSGFSPVARVWANVLAIIMVMAIYVRICIGDNFIRGFRLNNYDLIMLSFLLYGLFLIFYNYYLYQTIITPLNGFRTFFFGGIYYFICRFIVNDKQDIKQIIDKLLKVIFIVSILMIFEVILINYFKLSWHSVPNLVSNMNNSYVNAFGKHFRIPLKSGYYYRPLGILLHPHQTAFLIAILVSITFFSRQHQIKQRFLTSPIFFYISLISLILTTARVVIFCTILIILFGGHFLSKLYHKRRYSNIHAFFVVLLVFIIIVGMGIFDFVFTSIVKREDAFFQNINYEFYKDVDRINYTTFFFGKGFPPALGEAGRLEDKVTISNGEGVFGFRKLSSEIHILLYFERIGLIGGIFLILQLSVAARNAFKMARKESDNYFKSLYLGLSSCMVLTLLISFHVRPTSVVIQVFLYSIMGMISSLKSISHKEVKI